MSVFYNGFSVFVDKLCDDISFHYHLQVLLYIVQLELPVTS